MGVVWWEKGRWSLVFGICCVILPFSTGGIGSLAGGGRRNHRLWYLGVRFRSFRVRMGLISQSMCVYCHEKI